MHPLWPCRDHDQTTEWGAGFVPRWPPTPTFPQIFPQPPPRLMGKKCTPRSSGRHSLIKEFLKILPVFPLSSITFCRHLRRKQMSPRLDFDRRARPPLPMPTQLPPVQMAPPFLFFFVELPELRRQDGTLSSPFLPTPAIIPTRVDLKKLHEVLFSFFSLPYQFEE